MIFPFHRSLFQGSAGISSVSRETILNSSSIILNSLVSFLIPHSSFFSIFPISTLTRQIGRPTTLK